MSEKMAKTAFVEVLNMQTQFFERMATFAEQALVNKATLSKGQLLRYVEATRQNAVDFCQSNNNLVKLLEEEINGEGQKDKGGTQLYIDRAAEIDNQPAGKTGGGEGWDS